MRTAFRTGLAALVLLLLTPGAVFPQESFSFYGLQFGMARGDTPKHFPNDDGRVENPGHGMSSLELIFDREDFLMEIRATYMKPGGEFEKTGLQRALREKFVSPLSSGSPDISVTLDEYGNQAAITVIFQSYGIREKNIEYYKTEFLKMLD